MKCFGRTGICQRFGRFMASASQTEYTEREIYGKKSKTLVVPMYLYEGWTLIMLS
jgi:hypothetical protein